MSIKYTNNIPKAKAAIKRTLELSVRESATMLTSESQLRAPVDTGQLRASMRNEVDGLTATVGTDVDYAVAVEMGTSKQRSQPFLKNTFIDGETEVKEIVTRNLEKLA